MSLTERSTLLGRQEGEESHLDTSIEINVPREPDLTSETCAHLVEIYLEENIEADHELSVEELAEGMRHGYTPDRIKSSLETYEPESVKYDAETREVGLESSGS